MRIYGLYLECYCSKCGHVFSDKLLNLIDGALKNPRATMKGAVNMQKLAQQMESRIIEVAKDKGKPGKEKKKPKQDESKKKKKNK